MSTASLRESGAVRSVVVRCTKKMLDLLGREVTLCEFAPSDDDWYLNLLWIEREKGVRGFLCI
jgi:hypothetical protein